MPGTTCGAVLGTSTVTSYIESAAGVAEGGRTGLTAVVVAMLFLLGLAYCLVRFRRSEKDGTRGAISFSKLGVVALFLCNGVLRYVRVPHRRHRIDWLGAAVPVTGVSCLLLALSWGGTEYAWGSPVIVVLFLGGVLFFNKTTIFPPT